MSANKTLFQPFSSTNLELKNKVVMAPMTRCRATPDHIPTEIMATYYGERAESAGLIITEGTAPSPNGVGYARIPGIYNAAQTEAWKGVPKAVHEQGGKIFMQLMHTGRISHPANMPESSLVLAPSAIPPATTKMYVDGEGELEIPAPKQMTLEDIQNTIADFVQSTKNAIEAGFDGVEIHGANGYLVEQFINPQANQRSDEYGGSAENRCRFVLELAAALVAAVGAEKVGIRLSPNGAFNDVGPFDGQEETYSYLSKKLNEIGVVYIHLVNHEALGALPLPDGIRKDIQGHFNGVLILSGGYDDASAEKDLQDGKGDLVAFGRPLISNPDLVYRWKNNLEMNDPQMDKFYTPGPEGYIDYPKAT
ncbi:N-ethylmaleimide reductase [Robiginitalea myxolifaciens]|uniref:N-ethylmaleimide reductase n=1 Tax=Robiginitalea myxolifaciens TaxID=400055 RepID=A0A1I6HAT4_9FLAO|nr:alkene reductase [Robiginitalea myxolifaciens]SFR51595.1 N-ethylmaleimide reductase [Robiginitalea myxolifaciens]